MDYRHTEDFARQLEAAAIRAHALREQAIADFWRALSVALRNGLRAIGGRTARGRTHVLPEA